MGNICPGSNRRGTSREISNANSNRSSIMQSLNNSIFRSSNRPQHAVRTNNLSHKNDKNRNLVINGNSNYNAPSSIPATNVEAVNSRSLPPNVVRDAATFAPPVPIIIPDSNHENMKIIDNENQRELLSQSSNQNKNMNEAQNETRQIKVSPSASPKPKRKGKSHHRRAPSAAGLRVESVLNRKTETMKEVYTVGKKLGQGQFGTTYLVTHKVTGKEFACKSINKRKLINDDDVDDVKREIQIMHHVCGLPNIISIEGAYEDNLHVHVVMELCTGGELFDRIIKRGHYSEKRAAELARVIVTVVEACHSLGVMHRDLKPENFLFVNEDENAPLKAIDFGLSIFFKPDEVFNDVVGSPYYVAPEVLRKCYGPEADVWSAGVIIYILLSGVPPFWAETEQGIFEQVLNGKLDFDSDPWPKISDSAKDLVRRILVRNPKKRLTAHEVLCHPWLQIEGMAPDRPLDSAVLTRLKQFSATNHFKKMALRVIAENLSEEEIAGLKEMFKMIDTDNSGQITFEELKAGLARVGAHLDEPEVKALMEAADIDNSGTIDYAEFVAATMHWNKARRDDYLLAAFEYFDRDRSGYITHDELQKACEDFGIDGNQIEDIIREVDQNNDGRIDYSEFVAMMNKGDICFGRISPLKQSLTFGMRDALKVGHLASSSTGSDNSESNNSSSSPHNTTQGTPNRV
ncbi:Calcium-dependent protein kinase family protein [Rhynchospora pubera]|uniref:non-specific serine/threonine protein kinase n=1 Tax=Rhynchospora pubera TaxID=906938 RepID=A0AAV8CM67_9POAL|nr:Calcium-dependent protein kinase family protein [Rhynchospora pubera]